MKLIITESQKDRIIEKLIFKFLDKQNYNQLEIKDRIYFVKNIGDELAEIRFDKSDGWCYISYELVSFFSRMFSIEESDSESIIGRWVEHTLQMEVKYTFLRNFEHDWQLNIPYKWR